jgi:leader peptidase (prepilin peptidase)/N-methyltransferase
VVSAEIFILYALFVAWSKLLRYTATFLIKNCTFSYHSSTLQDNIDFMTAVWWLFAAYKISNFIPAYFLFFSALWITVHTDLKQMLISRFVSIYLVPVGLFLAWANFLPITFFESIIATIGGYAFFWIANKIFYCLKGHDGLGQGDLELIAMIGSFIGIIGCWCTILFASFAGTIFGCFCMLITQKTIKMLPFGPFLAFGAATFVLYQSEILNFLTI